MVGRPAFEGMELAVGLSGLSDNRLFEKWGPDNSKDCLPVDSLALIFSPGKPLKT